jgi:hypothetical protein
MFTHATLAVLERVEKSLDFKAYESSVSTLRACRLVSQDFRAICNCLPKGLNFKYQTLPRLITDM